MNEAQAYIDGWNAGMWGDAGRLVNPHTLNSRAAQAWINGFLHAGDAEAGEAPDPTCWGYGHDGLQDLA